MAPEFFNPKATLATLPPELLAHIVVHIDTARAISHLASTCRKAHAFVENDGFRIFVQTRFPYIKPPTKPSLSFWKEAAHGITSLSKNWDRKAFIAWSINPHEVNQDLKSQRSRGRPAQAGQTIGFTPVIDSYEAWYGGDWASRKEVVAWGAGAALFMRSKIMGKNKSLKWQTSDKRLLKGMNTHKQRYAYSTYSEKGADEGLDDITSVNLLLQQSLNDPEQIIIGRASRGLSLISLSTETSQSKIVSSYDTLGRAVRSATTKLGSIPLLAACLSDSTIALYPIDPKVSQVHPISQVSANPSDQSRTWSSRFLGHERLIVGLGPSQEPLHVYNIGQGEILRESVRALELSHISAHERMDLGGGNGIRSATSIYSLAPIDVSSSAGRAEGDVFLSGAYDGLTCLHDLRSANSITAIFQDPVDTFSPIYSLLSIGTERFVAGGARHSIIKVFDLRMPGGKLYHAADLVPCSGALENRPRNIKSRRWSGYCENHYDSNHKRRGWNVFLRPKDNTSRRVSESPVYALSRPSHCSPTFFAGLESTVLQFDMVSIMDEHPDPLFKYGQAKTGDKHDIERKWDSQGNVLCLPMYEHDTGPVDLIKQRKVEHTQGSIDGWDERWKREEPRPVDDRRRHHSWGLV
ncbi:MAG: hypothetical protein ASARMPREDX12_002062 [Alectoria sarmentosa]|nr:MAG: hypothetical protein ASARMPRED_007461 [Alectoria sarmentosa]CAD6585580.1 MAG: hypothetical protein ASARMPREDX12_002062 [Alectoria sarmentosa]